MLLDENRGIKSKDNNYTYTFLSSWSNHFKSWSNIKSFKTILIKYEDLEKNNQNIFKKLIQFVNSLLNNNQGIDYQKFNNALKTTSFSFLKKRERETGFLEAMFSEERDEKIPFFNLGFQNQWKKNLTDDVIKKIENKFQKEMRDLDYL